MVFDDPASHAIGLLPAQGYELNFTDRWLPGAEPHLDLVIFGAGCSQAAREVLAELGRSESPPAVLILSGPGEGEVGLSLLEAGADDHLAAPHNPREVLARVRALLRRRSWNQDRTAPISLGEGLLFDPIRGRITGDDARRVELTSIQARLLAALLAQPGAVLSRNHLIEQVLGHASDAYDRAIDVHVSRLRRRLAELGATDLIASYRGYGYGLRPNSLSD